MKYHNLWHLCDLFVTVSLGELAPAAAGSGERLVPLRWRVSSMKNMSDLKLPYSLCHGPKASLHPLVSVRESPKIVLVANLHEVVEAKISEALNYHIYLSYLNIQSSYEHSAPHSPPLYARL